jgi:hypothetical protein
MPDHIVALRTFIDAYENPEYLDGGHEPLYFFRSIGDCQLQHPGLPDGVLEFEEAALEEMGAMGLIDIDDSGNVWRVTPAALGRALLAESDRFAVAEPPVADLAPFLHAVEEQFKSENRLAWPAVRPVLLAMRRYWEDGGFSAHGVATRALVAALPERRMPMFVATMDSLIASDYLTSDSNLVVSGVVSEVRFAPRAHAVLDGWPGAEPDELVKNLLAVLESAATREQDPDRKRLLRRAMEAVKELGISTASEVLAKVITGGT